MRLVNIVFVLVGILSAGSAVAESAECLPPHVVILIYHHVADHTPASTSVTPAVFADHLHFIAENGFHVADLAEVVAALRAGTALPDSTVVLTFDDGYSSVYTEAFPRLRERGWPFTVFVCPDDIDGQSGPVMTWDQLREMAEDGVLIASHGLHHGFMNRQREGETRAAYLLRLEEELRRSRTRLVEELGSAPGLLAYPFGEYSPTVQGMVTKLGWTAFGQQSGAAGPASDFTCLPRFPMAAGFASMKSFGTKLACLPWPRKGVQPVDPMIAPDSALAPELRLNVLEECLPARSVHAFASGQGAIPVVREDGFLSIRAPESLPRGRSRYNVTAPVRGSGRFYWHSQIWIVGQDHDY